MEIDPNYKSYFINELASVKGITPEVLIDKIKSNADEYNNKILSIYKEQSIQERQIKNIKTFEDIASLKFKTLEE